MKTANWRDLAELIGIAAVVVGLLLVFQELRQSQSIARAQLNSSQMEALLDLNHREMDGEFSQIWVKSRTQPENLTLVEQHQVDAYLQSVLLIYRRELANYRLGIFEEWESLVNPAASYYFGEGYGRQFWAEQRDVFDAPDDAEFVRAIDTAISHAKP